MNKIQQVYKILMKHYGAQNWWPTVSSNKRFEICVGAILTQNTSWKNVEKAIAELKKANALNADSIKKMPKQKLAKLIKSSGYHNQKARKLKEFVNFKGSVTRDSLLSIWGIGPETADSILLYAYNKPAFVIDAYTKRIFSRLGMCSTDVSYNDLQNIFIQALPENTQLFNEYHALLVELAKRNCRPKPSCGTCALAKLCKKRI
ncbi:endonuclease [Candidatus Woesearchaeota archaeon]|nr:endonuclease [Candidatus Woesearchaeota archaeon]